MHAQFKTVPKTPSEVTYLLQPTAVIPETHSGAQLKGLVIKYLREKGGVM